VVSGAIKEVSIKKEEQNENEKVYAFILTGQYE